MSDITIKEVSGTSGSKFRRRHTDSNNNFKRWYNQDTANDHEEDTTKAARRMLMEDSLKNMEDILLLAETEFDSKLQQTAPSNIYKDTPLKISDLPLEVRQYHFDFMKHPVN